MESCIHCMGTILREQCMGGGEGVLWHSVDLVAGDGEHQRVPRQTVPGPYLGRYSGY